MFHHILITHDAVNDLNAPLLQVNTGMKTYYLSADTAATVDEWVRVLQVRHSCSNAYYLHH